MRAPKCFSKSCTGLGTYSGIMYRMMPRVSIAGKLSGLLKASGFLKASGRFKKEVRKMCRAHYLEYELGLWGYRCTDECIQRSLDSTEAILSPKELYVYVPLERPLAIHKEVCCPQCHKPMRTCTLKELNA